MSRHETCDITIIRVVLSAKNSVGRETFGFRPRAGRLAAKFSREELAGRPVASARAISDLKLGRPRGQAVW